MEVLNQIKNVVDSKLPDEVKFSQIIRLLSTLPQSVRIMMEMLDNERVESKELIQDLNLEVGRLDIMVSDPSIGGATKEQQKEFRNECINDLYKKWSGRISHCFRTPK